MTGADLLRLVIVLTSAAASVIWMRFAMTNRRYRLATIAPLTWLLHVLIFYAAREYGLVDAAALNVWSNAIRLHAVILCAGLGLVVSWK